MDRSRMIDTTDAVSITTACSECGVAQSVIQIKFRFSKDRVSLCFSCWAELTTQIDKFATSDSFSSRKWTED